jgi:hypothetical protein
MSAQIGQFLLVIGLILLVIFFGTDQVNRPAYNYFCGGLVILAIGIYLYWRDRPPAKPSGRFRILRGSNRPDQKLEEEKSDQKELS